MPIVLRAQRVRGSLSKASLLPLFSGLNQRISPAKRKIRARFSFPALNGSLITFNSKVQWTKQTHARTSFALCIFVNPIKQINTWTQLKSSPLGLSAHQKLLTAIWSGREWICDVVGAHIRIEEKHYSVTFHLSLSPPDDLHTEKLPRALTHTKNKTALCLYAIHISGAGFFLRCVNKK
jgi:hypothetical protein